MVKRFAHEIDPKTGYPIQHHLASITVLAPTSMTADGFINRVICAW